MVIGGIFVSDRRNDLPGRPYRQRGLPDLRRIVLHHVGGGVNRDYTAESIADYHVRVRGWPGIAYHFLAHPDGRLEYVGDILTVRYHVGQLNRESIGLCLAGDFTREVPSPQQRARAKELIRAIQRWARSPRRAGRPLEVYGHREVAHLTGYGPTGCPGDTWPLWREEMM